MEDIKMIIYRYTTTFKEDPDILDKLYWYMSNNFEEVFDEFYQELLKHERYKNKITPDMVPYLINRLRQFFSSWFSQTLNDIVVKLTENVVRTHEFVGLNDMDMMFGLTLLKKGFIRRVYSNPSISSEEKEVWIENLLNRISLVRVVFEHTYLYTKGLSVSRETSTLEDIAKQHLLNLFSIKKAIKNKSDLGNLNIPTDYTQCSIHRYIEAARQLNIIDSNDYSGLSEIHRRWHEEYERLFYTQDEQFITSLETITEEFIEYVKKISPGHEVMFLFNLDKVVLETIEFLLHLFDLFREEVYLKENLDEEELNRIFKTICLEYSHIFEEISVKSEQDLCLSRLGYTYRGVIYTSEQTLSIYIYPSSIIQEYVRLHPHLKRLFDSIFSSIVKVINVLLRYNILLVQSRKLVIQAEENARHKDIFLANMSHELRTPLNAIIGFSQILSKRKDIPDNIKQYIEKINIAGKTLLELINNVLDFVKLESGKVDIKPSVFEIKDLLAEVKSIVEPLVQSKGINFGIQNDLQNQEIFADYTLLKQVMLNLLSNAIKFTPAGGKIQVIVKQFDESNIILSVCDTGVGISKDDMDKIFKPFSQLDNPIQKSVKGTGLGLVIIKKIVEMHKGKIDVQSEVGKGTCFHINLPRNVYEKNFVSSSISNKEFMVVLVEDDKLFGEFLLSCLKDNFDVIWIREPSNINLYVNNRDKDKVFIVSDYLIKGYNMDSFIKNIDKTRFLLISAEDKPISISDDIKFIRKDNIECHKLVEYIKSVLSG